MTRIIMEQVFGNPTVDIFKHAESIFVSPEGPDESDHENDSFTPKKLPSLIAFVLTLFLPIISLAATTNTQVVAWGAGKIINDKSTYNWGQSIIPASLTNAVQVAGGQLHSLALKADGSLAAWGDDSAGETDVPPGTDYVAIACGANHSLALQNNGTVVAFGDSYFDQTDVPSGLSNVVAVACGWYHSMALKSDGTVVAWGAGTNLEPVGTTPNYGQTIVPAGLSNVVAIAGGGYHSMALKTDGTMVEWGDQASWGGDIPPGLSNVVAIATGAEHNVALLASGTLAVWGENTYGQTNIPAGLSNVVAVAAGAWHTLALKTDGTVVAWGAGIGSNTNVDFGQNIVPTGLSNVVQVAAGWVHSLVLVGSGRPVLAAPLTAGGFSTNGFDVTTPTRNGRVYQLEYANSLTSQAWTTLPLQFGTGGIIQLNDPAAAASSQRFYQVSRW
jgi:hypothetical protein